MTNQQQTSGNILEDLFSNILSMAIIYGVPLLLLCFGLYYIAGVVNNDIEEGVRVMAAALLPLSLTLAFAKSNARENTIVFLSSNRMVSFGFAFVMAMVTSWIAMYAGEYNDVPVGVLTFSATLALMVFGNDKRNNISFLHIGAVSGFLTYIIVFGVTPIV